MATVFAGTGCRMTYQQRAIHPQTFSARKNKTPSALADGVSEFNLDDDLLSHGETPHYHRRCIVSLLSSGWDQVVPMLYGRQEIRVPSRGSCLASANRVCDQVWSVSQTFGCCRLHSHRNLAFRRKLLGCYMVKPHGQLVWVSSTPHSAYTPHLSTS